jgi:molybdopterin synthase sulfur carrier subunit
VTVTLRLFAAAREAAGCSRADFDLDEARDIESLLRAARVRFGTEFDAVLATSRVWVNGDEPGAGDGTPLHDGDEVAVLPPVSGGAAPIVP